MLVILSENICHSEQNICHSERSEEPPHLLLSLHLHLNVLLSLLLLLLLLSALSLPSVTPSTMLFPPQKTPSFRPERSEVEKSASLPQPPAYSRRKTTTAKSLLTAITLFTALALSPPQAHAQGCTQCLDNTAATPPATQRAYRRAIILLTLTAGGLFATTLALFKRHR
jgi:hypothetical protein